MFHVKIAAKGNSVRLDPVVTLREALYRLATYLGNWTHDGHTLGLDSVEIMIEREAS
jgi:hypothetical protein